MPVETCSVVYVHVCRRVLSCAYVCVCVVFRVVESCFPQLLVSGESMVPDDRMTASGQWDEFHAPTRARMNSQGPDNDNNWFYRGGWVANSPWSDQQWIQARLPLLCTCF